MRWSIGALPLVAAACTSARRARLPLTEQQVTAINDDLPRREVTVTVSAGEQPLVFSDGARPTNRVIEINSSHKALRLQATATTAAWTEAERAEPWRLP